MTIASEVQKLETSAIVDLYILDATICGGGVVRFHSIHDEVQLWQGVDYAPWPIKAEGFGRTSDQQPIPKLTAANLDGTISAMCLQYEDLIGAKVIRKRTFAKYLDGQPDADPAQHFPDEIWFIERKSSESRKDVEFELSSPFNFAGKKLPGRQIVKNQCSFEYRGPYCNYTGPAVATIDDQPTSDPALDNCSRLITGCKLRLWPDGVLNFGGFVAAGLVRT